MSLRSFLITELFAILLTPAGLVAQTSRPQRASPIYVGLLDDARKEMVNWKPGVAPDRIVRPAFQKNGTAWVGVNSSSFPARVSWTVAFSGKSIGRLEGLSAGSDEAVRVPDDLTFIQVISTPPSDIPSIGVPQVRWAPLGMGQTKGRRPLVVVSRPNAADPDGWRRIDRLPAGVESSVRTAFRGRFPHFFRCRNESIVQRGWRFPDSALRFTSAYVSNKNTYLVEADLAAGDCGYVDDPNDPLAGPWFFVTASGRSRRIGAFMTLLDAGDYDNDGKSELIFMIEQPEDTEGFALFDADMQERASLLWSYH